MSNGRSTARGESGLSTRAGDPARDTARRRRMSKAKPITRKRPGQGTRHVAARVGAEDAPAVTV